MRNSLPVLIDGKGNLHVTDKQKADAFASVFQESAEYQNAGQNSPKLNKRLNTEQIQCGLPTFYPHQVNEFLRKLPSKNSAGFDGIPYVFLKKLSIALSFPLSKIFTVSFLTGEFPVQWKAAKVIPLHKKGRTDDPHNYRPISLNSTMSKVFEKMLKVKIIDHCTQNQLLSPAQFGFVPRKSVELQLLCCLNDWTKSYDNRHPTDVLYLDLSKAFDVVNHELLIDKLRS